MEASAGEQESRIGDTWGTGIRNLGYIFTVLNIVYDSLQFGMFVMLVEGVQRRINLVMLQQHFGGAGIFCEDIIYIFEYFHGAKGDIAQIADGGWNDIEFSYRIGVILRRFAFCFGMLHEAKVGKSMILGKSIVQSGLG